MTPSSAGPWTASPATISVKKANEAGIPVFMLGRTSAGGKVELIARADNISLGTIAAEELVRRIEEQRGEIAGKVLELHGPMDQVNARQRSEAIQAVLAKHPKIELIRKLQHWTPEEFFDITKSVASANELVGITMGSDVIPGVDAALDSLGQLKKIGEPGHIVVTGIDADPRILDLIGNDLWDASALQDMVGYGTILAHYIKHYLDGSFKITAAGPHRQSGRAVSRNRGALVRGHRGLANRDPEPPGGQVELHRPHPLGVTRSRSTSKPALGACRNRVAPARFLQSAMSRGGLTARRRGLS